MMNINVEINNLINYAMEKGLLDKRDRIYGINRLLDVLKLDSFSEPDTYYYNNDLSHILKNIRKWAVDNNRVEDDSVDTLDLFDTKLMAQLVKAPSEIEREFFNRYKNSPMESTNYYYEFSKNTNYIRENRIKNDIKWKHQTPYGLIDITINLSKPEKDPRTIAKAKELSFSGYPLCLLCKENEGYNGRIDHPGRGNHRTINIKLMEEDWFLQYSPYVYYNEHCIVFKDKHEPMKITKNTFQRLLEFVRMFPHYFIGSNADLPIVGGSILTHDHYQGGNYSFAMANAKEENTVMLENNIQASSLKWPMSVIRLKGKEIDSLVTAAYNIFFRWKNYSDETVGILSKTNGNEHNTITPICRFRHGFYELDLVLRNNRTSKERPFGVFHPREEYHHIKKENIGLIEVMGLAVLPFRLKKEMEGLKELLISGNLKAIEENRELNKHYNWSKMLMEKYIFYYDNVNEIINKEIGEVFLYVLKDAGVFKDDDIGRKAFKKCRKILYK